MGDGLGLGPDGFLVDEVVVVVVVVVAVVVVVVVVVVASSPRKITSPEAPLTTFRKYLGAMNPAESPGERITPLADS